MESFIDVVFSVLSKNWKNRVDLAQFLEDSMKRWKSILLGIGELGIGNWAWGIGHWGWGKISSTSALPLHPYTPIPLLVIITHLPVTHGG
ncbi:hypothetical protein CV014_26905 [Nostoc sp. CMAA1605]|nr:hypothetical protein [Nostoc sp. CMAA1605]